MLLDRGIYLSCGTSSDTGLAAGTIELVVTDPPFFDNVHYSELADFFYAWQKLDGGAAPSSTRSAYEVQDTRADQFAAKLAAVFRECHRILRDAGFRVINSQPVKSEMAVATPKSAAKEPIAFDTILVCRKQSGNPTRERWPGGNPTRQPGTAHTNPKRERGDAHTNAKRQRGESDSIATCPPPSISDALSSARSKIDRLFTTGFALSRNDRKIILYGQLLTTLAAATDATSFAALVDAELSRGVCMPAAACNRPKQQALFERV